MATIITDEMIESNKNRFIELIYSITRDFDKDLLVNKLKYSDFFEAPASAKYHLNVRGGLCKHCLNVYDSLVNLTSLYYPNVNPDSVKIVALLHDFSKMNLYEKTFFNKKVYSPTGSKYDNGGKFDWVSVEGYSVKDAAHRFVFGNHEQTSDFMISQFINMTLEEHIAVLHHHGSIGWDSAKDNISDVYNKYPLSLLLHQADSISTFILESPFNES